MSLPRPVLPGSTYLLTRRCTQRQFLLRPSREVRQILLYCLAAAAERFEIRIHAFCFLSNHYHLVATDPHAHLPDFMHWLNESIAKCINTLLRRRESLWAPGSYDSLRLETPADVLSKTVYTLANPVSSGLVARSERWPGLFSRPQDVGRAVFIARRPRVFFRSKGRMPEQVSLRLTPPPGAEGGACRDRWVAGLVETLEARETELRRDAACTGRGFLGARRILRQSPFQRAETVEVGGVRQPRIACRDRARRLEAIRLWKGFLDAYRDAWERFRGGDRTVEFPYGTYGMRVWYGVACASGP